MRNWILHPLLAYALLAAGMGLCLYLFWTVKLELRRQQKALAAALAEIRASAPGLDANKRRETLRMLGRGDSPAGISAALEIPRNQIDLLVKVQQLGGGERGPGPRG